ncbi:MAG: ammonium transporter [Armatimonadota bacterium]|nr:ammonium transporter [Armatimonadota bacterium]
MNIRRLRLRSGASLYLLVAVLLGIGCTPAVAGSAAKVDAGDTAWVLASTALVFLMTPGLGLFYGGMVRRKNVLATITQSLFICGIAGVLWILYGYTLAFGPDLGGLIGSLDWIGLRGLDMKPAPDPFSSLYGSTIPQEAHVIFQGMFAIITPALITGAFAERMRFKAYLIFIILWATLVYDPVAHWVWGHGGWLGELGALDFAGGTVVHICSGAAALCCALVIGRRKGYDREHFSPHNLTLTLAGTGLLWFGWFGFNAGSALAANGLAANAFVVTNAGAAAGMVSWVLAEWVHRGKPTALGAASGAIAGLVAVTPASGFVAPIAAVVIGLIAGPACYLSVMAKTRFRYDDSLDVFGIHGVGGIWGALATGLFAASSVNPVVATDAQGLFITGSAVLLGRQLIAIVSVLFYSLIVTYLILTLVGVLTPLRACEDEEDAGMDISQHGEVGYAFHP